MSLMFYSTINFSHECIEFCVINKQFLYLFSQIFLLFPVKNINSFKRIEHDQIYVILLFLKKI